jgi:Domain of unknown function (DUF6969)
MLERFRVRGPRPLALLNRWLGAVVTLFQPEIAELLKGRDQAIVEQRWRWRGNVLEDPRLEITSSREIDLETRLAGIDERARAPMAASGPARPSRLPRMADGWGS